MSKKIDLTKPLSATDRDYLLSRDRHSEVMFNSVVHGRELPKDVMQAMTERGITVEATEKAARAAGVLPGPEEAPEPVAAVSEDDSGPDDDAEKTDGPELYSAEWFDTATIAQLQPELRKRELPVTGKRGELADRLYDKMVDTGELEESEEDDQD